MKRYILLKNEEVAIDIPNTILDFVVCLACPPAYFVLSEIAAVGEQRNSIFWKKAYLNLAAEAAKES